MLAGLGEHLREQPALAESVRQNRDLWVMLFQLDQGSDTREHV